VSQRCRDLFVMDFMLGVYYFTLTMFLPPQIGILTSDPNVGAQRPGREVVQQRHLFQCHDNHACMMLTYQ